VEANVISLGRACLGATTAFEHGERTSKQDRQPDISDEGFSLIHGTPIKSRISRILGSGAVLSSCQKSFCWGTTLVWAPCCACFDRKVHAKQGF